MWTKTDFLEKKNDKKEVNVYFTSLIFFNPKGPKILTFDTVSKRVFGLANQLSPSNLLVAIGLKFIYRLIINIESLRFGISNWLLRSSHSLIHRSQRNCNSYYNIDDAS